MIVLGAADVFITTLHCLSTFQCQKVNLNTFSLTSESLKRLKNVDNECTQYLAVIEMSILGPAGLGL